MKKVEELKPMGMVAVAPGDGLANLFTDLTVDQIIAGGQTMNPSAADIANAAAKVQAENVFVFPNNKNIILAAEQAKGLTDRKLHVVPTRNVPEGIAASLAFNPEASAEENLEAMTTAIECVKSGSVTYAVRATHVDGFDLSVGEIIGLDDCFCFCCRFCFRCFCFDCFCFRCFCFCHSLCSICRTVATTNK